MYFIRDKDDECFVLGFDGHHYFTEPSGLIFEWGSSWKHWSIPIQIPPLEEKSHEVPQIKLTKEELSRAIKRASESVKKAANWDMPLEEQK